jgi:hypothetical protein
MYPKKREAQGVHSSFYLYFVLGVGGVLTANSEKRAQQLLLWLVIFWVFLHLKWVRMSRFFCWGFDFSFGLLCVYIYCLLCVLCYLFWIFSLSFLSTSKFFDSKNLILYRHGNSVSINPSSEATVYKQFSVPRISQGVGLS